MHTGDADPKVLRHVANVLSTGRNCRSLVAAALTLAEGAAKWPFNGDHLFLTFDVLGKEMLYTSNGKEFSVISAALLPELHVCWSTGLFACGNSYLDCHRERVDGSAEATAAETRIFQCVPNLISIFEYFEFCFGLTSHAFLAPTLSSLTERDDLSFLDGFLQGLGTSTIHLIGFYRLFPHCDEVQSVRYEMG
jgi:hypothetical protein